MNTPNPLVPQGSLQATKGRSNVRLAVISIVAIHVVFFGGLLLQGCKRDTAGTDAATNNTTVVENVTTAPSTTGLPPLDTNSLYYPNPSSLPTDQGQAANNTITNPGFASTPLGAPPVETTFQTNPLNSDPANMTGAGAGATIAPAGETKSYTVKKGDNYTRIAKSNGITLSALKAANPSVDPAKLQIGQKLSIPAAAPRASATTGGSTGSAAGGSASDGTTYTVVAGDTLTKIAKKHGTTVSALRGANGMKVSQIKVGQKIKIPAASSTRTVGATTSPLDPSTAPASGFGNPVQQ